MQQHLAFSLPETEYAEGSFGLSKREYYAIHIMNALLSNPATIKSLTKKGAIDPELTQKFVRAAIDMADYTVAFMGSDHAAD